MVEKLENRSRCIKGVGGSFWSVHFLYGTYSFLCFPSGFPNLPSGFLDLPAGARILSGASYALLYFKNVYLTTKNK